MALFYTAWSCDSLWWCEGHATSAALFQEVELRHNVRRLSSHPSLVIWDGCNECPVVMGSGTAIYATFVMTVVAQEDTSRAVWPSCPALGWTTGVRRLDSIPTGSALTTPPNGTTYYLLLTKGTLKKAA